MARQSYESADVIVIDDQQNELQSAEEELLASLRDAEDTAEITLYRQKTQNHKDSMAICESWSADSITWSAIQKIAKEKYIPDATKDTYFRVMIRQRGKLVAGGNKPFCIAGQTASFMPSQVPNNGETASLIAQGFQMIAQQNAEMMRQFAAALQRPEKDPYEEMTKMVTIMNGLKTAMGAATVQESVSPFKMMEQAFAFQERMMTMADQARERLGNNDASKNDDGVIGVIGALTPLVQEGIGAIKTAQELKAAEIAAQTRASAVETAARAQNNPSEKRAENPRTLDPRREEFRANLLRLLPFAKISKEPAEVAAFINKVVTDQKQREFFGHEKALAAILQLCPEFIPYADWVSDVLAELDALTGDENTDHNGREIDMSDVNDGDQTGNNS